MSPIIHALLLIQICSRHAFAACPYANELSQLFGGSSDKTEKEKAHHVSHHHRHLRSKQELQHDLHGHLQNHRHYRDLEREDGLWNAGRGCWGNCNFQAGDCDFCGTGQCCRERDYENGVVGCELAINIKGAICGSFRGEAEERLRNLGKACWGHCNGIAGDCPGFCGTGQCCRRVDGERDVPGCDLAGVNWLEGGPGSQCGEFNGLMNENKGCWGHCGGTPGDCDYCGTGQCCRQVDYENGVDGCELAANASGARCGRFRGEPEERLRNGGKACRGHCNNESGDCGYCGTGQCCRLVDAERCEPGCELASINWLEGGPASQCGAFSDPEAECANANEDSGPPTPQAPANSPDSNDTGDDEDDDDDKEATELLNEGISCGGPSACNIVGENLPGDCDWCGTGQCCSANNWWRGVPGCELAENVTGNAVCGAFSSARPQPSDFRLEEPFGTYSTPDEVPSDTVTGGIWIKDIEITGDHIDYVVPEYSGDGGQPWSRFEMAMVRDLLLHEIRQASMGRDETGAAKFIRLPFHDCLLYSDGTGGCDGCLNWDHVGFEFEGRVEDRNFEDHERTLSNNGLGEAVEFLEYIYTLDFGKSWANGCWMKPGAVSGGQAWVADTRTNPFTVSSIEECKGLCQNYADCRYFTVPHLRSVDSTGPCRLFSDQGTLRETGGNGRLIAADAYCSADSWSLESTGKSRADLWAFASLVAVEEGIQRHNWACDGNRRSPHNGPIMCTQFEGEEGCHISLDRPFVFQTGRKDCDTALEPSYKTEKMEHLPDEHFNGTMTVRFMEEHYKFSAKETVTIMGAHTMGTFHQHQTGHKYVWTSDFQAFNNQFYRNIAGRDDWFFDDDECTRVGDAWGNKGHAVWITKMNQAYRSGGPIQWIQKKVVCPNCADRSYERGGRHPERLAQDRDCCLRDVPEGAQCRPDGFDAPGTKAIDRDDDYSDGCEYSHFIFGTDEAALGSDMGLVYKFDVDTRGFPSGCPGLATFYPSGNRFSDYTCGIDGRPWFADPSLSWNDIELERVTKNEWTDRGCPVDCPRQDYKYPGDSLSLADHVERYADDQDAWIQEFIPVMEKMIANGYTENDLVVSFNGSMP